MIEDSALSLKKAYNKGEKRTKKEAQNLLEQADTSYMKSAWIDFDIPKKPGLWISYSIGGLVRI